jgi:peroxiredoxin Q/BCP
MEMKQTKTLFLMGMLVASVLVLTSVATALEVGEKAPDFTLQSTNGEKISLSQYRGKKIVLIQFYTTDFNPT